MTCACGSGAHPRRCEEHSQRYQAHCNELSVESLSADVERLEAEVTKLRAALDAAEPDEWTRGLIALAVECRRAHAAWFSTEKLHENTARNLTNELMNHVCKARP